jgi:hypothetical protein
MAVPGLVRAQRGSFRYRAGLPAPAPSAPRPDFLSLARHSTWISKFTIHNVTLLSLIVMVTSRQRIPMKGVSGNKLPRCCDAVSRMENWSFPHFAAVSPYGS